MAFLKELNVKQDELKSLQDNTTVFAALPLRYKTILNKALRLGFAERANEVGVWTGVKPCNANCAPHLTYRICKDLVLLPEDECGRPEDRRKPFKWRLNGQLVWCCPIFAIRSGLLLFRHPRHSGDFVLSCGNSFDGYLGFMGESPEGLPLNFDGNLDIFHVTFMRLQEGARAAAFLCFQCRD
jgi:hypothetical protein